MKNILIKKTALVLIPLMIILSGCLGNQKDLHSVKAQGITYFYVPKSDDNKCNDTMVQIAKTASESLENYLSDCIKKQDLTTSKEAKMKICETGLAFKYLWMTEQLQVKQTVEGSKAHCNWKAID